MEFSLHKADIEGFVGSDFLEYVGARFKHYKNNKYYTVLGVQWMGETDTWGLSHISPEGVVCVRSIKNFFSFVHEGDFCTTRFTKE